MSISAKFSSKTIVNTSIFPDPQNIQADAGRSKLVVKTIESAIDRAQGNRSFPPELTNLIFEYQRDHWINTRLLGFEKNSKPIEYLTTSLQFDTVSESINSRLLVMFSAMDLTKEKLYSQVRNRDHTLCVTAKQEDKDKSNKVLTSKDLGDQRGILIDKKVKNAIYISRRAGTDFTCFLIHGQQISYIYDSRCDKGDLIVPPIEAE